MCMLSKDFQQFFVYYIAIIFCKRDSQFYVKFPEKKVLLAMPFGLSQPSILVNEHQRLLSLKG